MGLAVLLVLAPLPFGAVGPRGRLLIETGAVLLLLVWIGRALFRETPLPPRWVSIGILGMLSIEGWGRCTHARSASWRVIGTPPKASLHSTIEE